MKNYLLYSFEFNLEGEGEGVSQRAITTHENKVSPKNAAALNKNNNIIFDF